MKRLAFIIALIASVSVFGQTRKYAHKVEVTDTLQTKNYTYLHVKEVISGKDSLQWLALPRFDPAIGNVFYYDSGLRMGEFHSAELNRTFPDIVFLGSLSTTEEVSNETVISALPAGTGDSTEQRPADIHNVKVLEVLQTTSYTYLRVQEGQKEEWLACTKVMAKKGDDFYYDDAAMMNNFTSKELNRTFPEVLFVAKLHEGKGEVKPAPGSDGHALKTPDVDQSKFVVKSLPPATEKIPGILTVEQVWTRKDSLDGKIVTLKGKVTRFSSNILNSNWLHLTDGTATAANKDIIITTAAKFKPGDEIKIEGTVRLHRDFGSGYSFEMLLEEGKVVE
ncbi:MAG: OB-fold nucleic acid binding domain-containing protein [Bacteroidia bacterium]